MPSNFSSEYLLKGDEHGFPFLKIFLFLNNFPLIHYPLLLEEYFLLKTTIEGDSISFQI